MGMCCFPERVQQQGDPLAMPMYALATIPLMRKLTSTVHQTCYADDAAGTGKLSNLRKWWDDISVIGPGYGYFANAPKTWLITKSEYLDAAKVAFTGTNVNITVEGRPYRGAPLDFEEYTRKFMQNRVGKWCEEIKTLAEIAHTQPQAEYAAYTQLVVFSLQSCSQCQSVSSTT